MASISQDSLLDIERRINIARALGMSEDEIEILREYLLTQAIELTAEERLKLEIAQLPQETQTRIGDFAQASEKQLSQRNKLGKQGLNSISSEEWEALVNDANETE